MHYIELTGDYCTAYQNVLENGGQLYPGNGKDSAIVVVQGNNCTTYWKKGSKRKQDVAKLCDYFGLPPEGKTGGRIARWFIDEFINLPYQGTYWQKNYREMAKWGGHWHYSTVQPFKPQFCIEVDLKSAYFSSLLAGKSLLYENKKGYLEDNLALEKVAALLPTLPKWFRLQLLGVLASWRMFFLARDKSNPDSNQLVQKYYHKISYGAAFNAAHRAILRNYKIMERVHKIGGEYILRMHTDSFFLSANCPRSIELDIWNYLEEKKVNYGIKGSGKTFFFDLNTGFIGRKFIGAKVDVVEQMRNSQIRMQKTDLPNEIVDRFGNILEASNSNLLLLPQGNNREEQEFVQMNLFSEVA